MNTDVHIAGPNFPLNRGQWSETNIEEISTWIEPFFGNSVFSRDYAWYEDYRYYALYEVLERFVQVFRCEDRSRAFEQAHEKFQSSLTPVVSAQSKRPSAAVVWVGDSEPKESYPYAIDEGTNFEHLSDLEVSDALVTIGVWDFYSNRGVVDFETPLEVDPGVLLVHGREARTCEEFQNTIISFMENHEMTGELTVVQNSDVYRTGVLHQDPITNLITTDRLMWALYDAGERLFDVQHVVDITNGNLQLAPSSRPRFLSSPTHQAARPTRALIVF